MNYYPLAEKNEWQYKMKDGSTYVNKVMGVSGSDYTMHNSSANTSSTVRREGTQFLTDALEAGNFQVWLGNDLQAGQSWEVTFKANGLDCILVMTVKETGVSKEVEGKTYPGVMCIEGENKILMNGTIMPLNFFTQYYYADGIGLVLTTSSAGDSHALINHSLH
jgi:hypothetical protein